jgi:hypothetical protein
VSQRWRGSLLAILVFSVYYGRAGFLSLHSCLETAVRLLHRLSVQRSAMDSKPIRLRTSIRSSPATTRPESGVLGKPFLGTYGVSVRSTSPSLSDAYGNPNSSPNQSPKTHDVWTRRYGRTWRFHGFGAVGLSTQLRRLPATRLTAWNENKFDFRLITFDFRAVGHVLNSPKYEKPWQTQRFLSRLIGQGVFAKEGQEHRWQVRNMLLSRT